MEVKDSINNRKSIRKYLDKDVSSEDIDELISAVRLSPSAYNSQPWKLKIVNDKSVFSQLKSENVFKHDFVCTASLIIVFCGDLSCYPERASEMFNTKELCYGDIGISSENMVLRATELGLGTCYVAIVDRPKIKKILNIPKDYIIPYVITVGYSDESLEPRSSIRKEKEEIVF